MPVSTILLHTMADLLCTEAVIAAGRALVDELGSKGNLQVDTGTQTEEPQAHTQYLDLPSELIHAESPWTPWTLPQDLAYVLSRGTQAFALGARLHHTPPGSSSFPVNAHHSKMYHTFGMISGQSYRKLKRP